MRYPPSAPSRLVVGVGGSGLECISDDNLGTMRTYSAYGGVTFDFVYHRMTLLLFSGGPDVIFHDDGKAYG
ncbi:hypothetical protein N7507_005185 [Penicillium longicatenatum]|nr:hypothetical protein N7507_005185 [Penicillium longicatenatum]